jgi:hypothetical protein
VAFPVPVAGMEWSSPVIGTGIIMNGSYLKTRLRTLNPLETLASGCNASLAITIVNCQIMKKVAISIPKYQIDLGSAMITNN